MIGYGMSKMMDVAMMQRNAIMQQQAFISNLGDFSMSMTIGGSVTAAIGVYYDTVNQQNQRKAQALSQEFSAQTAEFNANMADQQVGKVREVAEAQIGISNMRYAEDLAEARTGAAGRGVKVDTGSAREQQRAINLMKTIDAMTIKKNADGQMTAIEMGAADQRASALLSRTSASNISKTAKAMSPASAYLTTSIGSAGRVAGMYYERFGGIR